MNVADAGGGAMGALLVTYGMLFIVQQGYGIYLLLSPLWKLPAEQGGNGCGCLLILAPLLLGVPMTVMGIGVVLVLVGLMALRRTPAGVIAGAAICLLAAGVFLALAFNTSTGHFIEFSASQCHGELCSVSTNVDAPPAWSGWSVIDVGVAASFGAGFIAAAIAAIRLSRRQRLVLTGVSVGCLVLAAGLVAGGLQLSHSRVEEARNKCEWVQAIKEGTLPWGAPIEAAAGIRTAGCADLSSNRSRTY